jgi:hypothetical protein
MTATIATYEAVHRELWPRQRVEQELFQSSAFLGLMRRDSEMGYKGKHIALQYARPQGRSRQFATAQANVGSSKFRDFFIDPLDDYAVVQLEGKLIRSSKNPSDAFIVDVLERETNGAMDTLRQSSSFNACGDGLAVRGVVDAGGISESGGNTIIVLDAPDTVKNFEEGMVIVAAATATGATRGSNAGYEVIGVNAQTGTVTVSGTAITTSSWAAGDSLFQQGDAQNGGSARPMLAGFFAWIPSVTPTSGDSFFGVDRSDFPNHLAGWRLTAAGLSTTTIRETLMKSMSTMARMVPKGKAPSVAVMNPEDKGDFLAELEVANVWNETIERRGEDANIYYQGIRVQSPIGPLDVFDEPQWPKGRVGLVNPQTWQFHTIGEQPEWIEEDGLRFKRRESSDNFEARMVIHPQVSCDAPLYNANVLLP